MSQWTLACCFSTPHSTGIRGSRCTALIHVLAEEPVTWQLSCGTATVATWHDVSIPSFREWGLHTRRSLSFGHSESRRWPTKWYPYQSATGAAPSSALCRPPGPSYKADDRTWLYKEKVDYCCSSSNPNSRTWITLGKHALPPGRGTLWSHLLPEGVKWHWARTQCKNSSSNTNDLYIHYMDKSTGTPPSLEEKKAYPNCQQKWKNNSCTCVSTSVATVLKCMKWLYPYVIGVWWWIFGSRSAFKVTPENMNHPLKLPQRAECPDTSGIDHTQKRTGDKTTLKRCDHSCCSFSEMLF